MRMIIFAFFLLLFSSNSVASGKQHSIEEIQSAWKKRTSSKADLEYKWNQLETHKEGSVTPPVGEKRSKPSEFNSELRLVLSGRKYRFDVDGMNVNWETRGFEPERFSIVSNGETETKYHQQTPNAPPTAHIFRAETRTNSLRLQRCLAPVLFFRPLEIVENLEKGVVKTVNAKFRSYNCVVIEIEESPSSSVEVWLTASNGYYPLRYIEKFQDLTCTQIEITPRESDDGTLIPDNWTSIIFWAGTSNIRTSYQGQAKDYSPDLSNAKDVFDVEIKPGSWVNDYTVDAQKGENYVILNNGEKRVVLPGEFDGTNFDELLTGTKKAKSNFSRYFYIGAFSSIVLGLFGFYFFKRRN